MVETLRSNPLIVEEYARYESNIRSRNAMVGAWTILFAMLAGTLLDSWVYPDKIREFFIIRLWVSLSMIPTLILLKKKWVKTFLIEVWIVLSPVIGIALMIAQTEGSRSPYYAGINLVLLGVGVFLRWRLEKSVVLCLSFLAIYLAACAYADTNFFNDTLYVNVFFLCVTSFLICVGGSFYYQIMFREFGLRFELKRNQSELAEKNKQLRELDQIKSQFFANISHELRTPLTLIIGPLSRLLKREDLQGDVGLTKTLRSMESNSLRLLQLINDLLELVRIESGAIRNVVKQVKLLEFVKGVVASCQGLGDEKRLNIRCEITLKEESFYLDAQHLEKILLNLIFNSIKFTSLGGTITVRVKESADRLFFVVEDNGIGMSEEAASRAFEMFWQQDNSSRRKFQGVGIGLALVKNLVDTMEGKLEVKSAEGEGTTISFSIPRVVENPHAKEREKLPLEMSEMPDAQTEELETVEGVSVEQINRQAKYYFPKTLHSSSKESFTNLLDHRKPKILVADDEPEMLDYICNAIEDNYLVVRATDGPQAEATAKQVLPSLIILDMMMPEKNGIEVAQALSDDFITQSIPVLMLTARADEETKLSALRAGVNDFLTKPFSHTELEVRMENLLNNSHLQVELAKKNTELEETLQKLKDSEMELVRQEKFASIGRLSAGLVHEINNPLNYVKASIYHLKTFEEVITEDQSEYVDTLKDLEEGVMRVVNIITDLKTLTQAKSGDRKEVSVASIVKRCLSLADKVEDDLQVDIDILPDLFFLANENQMTQVLINIFNNACDAMKSKGAEALLQVRGYENVGRVIIQIEDNGTGIDQAIIDKVFDPFFTTKDVGSGMGLGLAITYQWVKQNNGDISVRSVKGEKTVFTIELEKFEPERN